MINLTPSAVIGHNSLDDFLRSLGVHGAINTKQKCPICGGKFKLDSVKSEFCCTEHKTRPNRYYLNGKVFGLGHIYSEPQNRKVFETFSQALDVLLAINRDFRDANHDKKTFEKKYGKKWLPERILEYRIENVCERWLINHREEARKNAKSQIWVNQLENTCNNFIVPFFGGRDLHDLTRDDIEKFYHHLLDKKYSPKYIKEILSVLKSLFFRYRPADIPEFPSFSIVPFREKQRLGFAREIAVVDKVPERNGYRLAILVLLRTGMRINEVTAIKVHNLDDGIIYVNKAISDGRLRLSRKSGGEVAYSVTPEVWQLLMKHIEDKGPDDYVFEINRKPITTDRLYKVWKNACCKAKIKHISLQQASRHSKATEIMAEYRKKALQEIAKQLGHDNIVTGAKHYIVEK